MVRLIPSRFRAAPLALAAAALCVASAGVARYHAASHPRRAVRRETPQAPAAPHGVTTVPATGLKVYCTRHSPLLVRKMTQGAGTTVTVICR